MCFKFSSLESVKMGCSRWSCSLLKGIDLLFRDYPGLFQSVLHRLPLKMVQKPQLYKRKQSGYWLRLRIQPVLKHMGTDIWTQFKVPTLVFKAQNELGPRISEISQILANVNLSRWGLLGSRGSGWWVPSRGQSPWQLLFLTKVHLPSYLYSFHHMVKTCLFALAFDIWDTHFLLKCSG